MVHYKITFYPKLFVVLVDEFEAFLRYWGHICFLRYDLLKFKNEGNRLGKVDLNI